MPCLRIPFMLDTMLVYDRKFDQCTQQALRMAHARANCLICVQQQIKSGWSQLSPLSLYSCQTKTNYVWYHRIMGLFLKFVGQCHFLIISFSIVPQNELLILSFVSFLLSCQYILPWTVGMGDTALLSLQPCQMCVFRFVLIFKLTDPTRSVLCGRYMASHLDGIYHCSKSATYDRKAARAMWHPDSICIWTKTRGGQSLV